MEEIIKQKREIEKELLKKEGVVSVGVGRDRVNGEITGDTVITVSVEHKKSEKDIDDKDIVPKEINGFKIDVVDEGGKPKPEVNVPWSGAHRPMKMGTSAAADIGDIGAGTIGIPVIIEGELYTLTNRHTAAPDGDTTGNFTQPSAGNDGGWQSRFIAGNPIDYLDPEVADAAIVKIDSGLHPETIGERVMRSTSRYPDIDDVGSKVWKEGRTTGYTRSEIDAIDVSFTAEYGGTIGTVTMENNIRVINNDELSGGEFSDDGDSGSIYWIDESGNLPIGLHFAGGSSYKYGSYLQLCLDEFNATISSGNYIAAGGGITELTLDVSPVGDPGFIWIEDSLFKYLDGMGYRRELEKGTVTSVGAQAGYIWVDTDTLHYTDESGNKVAVNADLYEHQTADDTYLWVEGDYLFYTGTDGNVYRCKQVLS